MARRKAAPKKKPATTARKSKATTAPRGFRKLLIGGVIALLGMLGIGGASYYGVEPPPLAPAREFAENVTERSAELLPGRDASEMDVVIGHVERVVDGDTLVVSTGQQEEKVRLLCVDTPESVHSDSRKNTEEGRRAAEFAKELLEDRQVRLLVPPKNDHDNFGRRLAYVFLDGENVNLRLVKEGWSPYYTKYGRSPYYDGDFRKAEREAEEAGRGVWGK